MQFHVMNMIDQNKRDTLKVMALSTGTVLTGTYASVLSAYTIKAPQSSVREKATQTLRPTFIASVHFTTKPHGVEVHLVNASNNTQLIDQISPSSTIIDSGEFRFSKQLKLHGGKLKPGKSLIVPLELHTHSNNASNLETLAERFEFLNRIEAALRCSMQIVNPQQEILSVAIPRCVPEAIVA